MEEKKKISRGKSGLILVLVVLAIAAAVAVGFYLTGRNAGSQGAKTIAVQVIHGDGSTKNFELHTDKKYLGDALVENKVVEDNQGAYGLYILTADGETANESKQEWWCITKGGEGVMLGASEQPISDGEQYELTFTVGYDS